MLLIFYLLKCSKTMTNIYSCITNNLFLFKCISRYAVSFLRISQKTNSIAIWINLSVYFDGYLNEDMFEGNLITV
jgi:hypothetical protein